LHEEIKASAAQDPSKSKPRQILVKRSTGGRASAHSADLLYPFVVCPPPCLGLPFSTYSILSTSPKKATLQHVPKVLCWNKQQKHGNHEHMLTFFLAVLIQRKFGISQNLD